MPCICGDKVLRHTELQFLQPNYQSHLGSGPQLCCCWTMELSNPASAHIAARGLRSKPVPHCGNWPYCSCHGKQAPSPPVVRRRRCKAARLQNTDDAQMLPTSAGAVKPLQSEPELTAQPLQICGRSLRVAALLPHFSPPAPRPPPPPCFSSLLLSDRRRVSNAAPLCMRGRTGSARGREAVSELWSCALLLLFPQGGILLGFSGAELHVYLRCRCELESITFTDIQSVLRLKNPSRCW